MRRTVPVAIVMVAVLVVAAVSGLAWAAALRLALRRVPN